MYISTTTIFIRIFQYLIWNSIRLHVDDKWLFTYIGHGKCTKYKAHVSKMTSYFDRFTQLAVLLIQTIELYLSSWISMRKFISIRINSNTHYWHNIWKHIVNHRVHIYLCGARSISWYWNDSCFFRCGEKHDMTCKVNRNIHGWKIINRQFCLTWI